MKLKGLVKMAAAAVAALFLMSPMQAEAAETVEIIDSVDYGRAVVIDLDGVKGVIFAEAGDGVMQFIKEAAGDPYFVRYNYLDATLARLKAGATSITVLDEYGDVIATKGEEEIRQDVANHLAIVDTLNRMTPEEIREMEEYQLALMDMQEELLDEIRKMSEPELKQMIKDKDEDAEGAKLLLDMLADLQKVLDAKRQTVLLYQKDAAPEQIQMSLLQVQEEAARVQQELADFCKMYEEDLAELMADMM